MRRVLYVLLSYFGFCAFMCVLLAVGAVVDWFHDRRDRRLWTEQRLEIQRLPEVDLWLPSGSTTRVRRR